MNTAGNWIFQDQTVLPIYSLAKPFIAAGVHQLGIDLKASVSRWISKQHLPHGDDICIEHLLKHTSGLRDYTSHPDYWAAVERKEPPWSDDAFAQRSLQMPLLTPPGERFAYSNPGYWLLTQIICRETDRDLDRSLRELVFEPLNMQHTRQTQGVFAEELPHYPSGWVWHGLFLSTADDCVRFMHSQQAKQLSRDSVNIQEQHPGWREPHYAHGLMMEPGECYGHLGGGPRYGAACLHFTQLGLTGCALGTGSEEERLNELRAAISELASGD